MIEVGTRPPGGEPRGTSAGIIARGGAAGCPARHRVAVRHERWDVPCGKRTCSWCGRLWGADARAVIGDAMAAYDGDSVLVTITAPGADVLPWDGRGTRCHEPELTWWNEAASSLFSAWWADVTAAPRREASQRGTAWGLLAKVWEEQKRGALHLHLVLPFATPCERETTTWVVEELRATNEWYGFGHVDCGRPVWEDGAVREHLYEPIAPERAAGYVAKYLGDDTKGEQSAAALARRGTFSGPLLYTNRRLTQLTGSTMRSQRWRRRVHAVATQKGRPSLWWRAAALMLTIQRGRPPLTDDSRRWLLETARAERWTSVVDVDTGEEVVADVPPPGWTQDQAEAVEWWAPRRGAVRLDWVVHAVPPDDPRGPVRVHASAATMRPPP